MHININCVKNTSIANFFVLYIDLNSYWISTLTGSCPKIRVWEAAVRRIFFKIGVLKHSSKLTGKHLCRSLFNKVFQAEKKDRETDGRENQYPKCKQLLRLRHRIVLRPSKVIWEKSHYLAHWWIWRRWVLME